MFLTFLKHEIGLYVKRGGETLNLITMFIMAASFFVMSQSVDTPLDEVTGGVVWVCALLVLGIVQYRLYERDYIDGTLEQWAFLRMPLEMVVLAKCLAHWLVTALPLLIVAPIMGVMITQLPPRLGSLTLSLGLGTVAFIFLGSLAAAISLRFRSRDLLTTLLIMPLAVPVLIMGSMASAKPISLDGEWAALMAYVLVVMPLSCFLSAMLLRFSQE
jgi:heme exporter protein B